MRAREILNRTAAAGLIAGAAFLVSAGPLARDAEAGPKHRSKARYVAAPRASCYTPAPVCRPPRYVHVHSVACHCADRPWYVGARRVYVRETPYYFNAAFNVYFGGLALDFAIANTPPPGYEFYDPYCATSFCSLAEYNAHQRRHRYNHPSVLHAVVVVEHGQDRWYEDHGSYGHDDDDDDGNRGRGHGRRGR